MNQIQRFSNAALVLLLLFLPIGVYAVIRLPIGSSGVHQWLPDGRIERQRYEQFLERFGSDQVLLMSWDGASLDDPRIETFVQRLRESKSYDQYFSSIVSPVEVAQSLESPPLRLDHATVLRRLRGTLIGPDDTPAIVAMISEQGVRQHAQVIALVRQVADAVPQLGSTQLRMVGSVYESYSVDVAAEESLTQLVLPSTILALLASWLCVGSFRAVVLVMLLAGSGQLMAVSLVYFGGYEFSAVLIVLPTLIFMLTLSGAVHLVNYYFDSLKTNTSHAGILALSKGWWPCTLSSATTMLGMGSLLTSELIPVQQFGMLSAVCLGISTLVLLAVFPAAAKLVFSFGGIPARSDSLSANSVDQRVQPQPIVAPTAGELSETVSISEKLVGRYLPWLYRNANRISLLSLLLLAIASAGLYYLRSSTRFCDMFPESHQTHRDMVWFEKNVGLIATLEVLLNFERADDQELLSQAKLVAEVSKQLQQFSSVGGVFSAISMLPNLSDTKGIRATVVRAAQQKSIESHFDQLCRSGMVHQTEKQTTWRISSRVSALKTDDYGQLSESVRQIVDQVVASSPLQPRVELTGLTPVLHETHTTLLSDLGYSFLSAYLLITPVMMWIVLSFRGGLLIMIPNVLPVALAFGWMGWFGWPLDIAGILTASVALGIAVDDTLHFVCWYSNCLDSDGSRLESRLKAVQTSFRACALAMLSTTFISCCAMMPFLFANFIPTRQFATLMICILTAAIVGDLLLLPALLLSPAGKVIRSKQRQHDNTPDVAG